MKLFSNNLKSRLSKEYHEDAACIIFTSGSTGCPKGVMLSNENLIFFASTVSSYLNITDEDRILCVLPLCYTYGLNQILITIFSGATIVFQPNSMILQIPYLIDRYQITGLAGVPIMWSSLARLKTFGLGTTSSLRYITSSGGKISNETIKALRNTHPCTRLYLMYGLTEALRVSYCCSPSLESNRINSVGRAVQGMNVYVLDKDNNLCKSGEVGELVCSGEMVALGYLGDKTSDFVYDEKTCTMYFYTGDYGYMDSDGYIFLKGRKNQLVKHKGFRISLVEIEDNFYDNFECHSCVVINIDMRIDSDTWIVLFYVADKDYEIRGIYQQLSKSLAEYYLPNDICFLDFMPINLNGKVDYSKLREIYLEIRNE